MARHGCGVFGNTAADFDPSFVDRVDHLFDCIEIDQTFSFYDGQAYFSSRYYDSNIAYIFREMYDQDMTKSSFYYGSILSRMNDSQIDRHHDDMNDGSR